ncbi:sperm-associated antigen 16 protein-like [Brachyistius frenatus]|uniref:sperm-associated antigen 16 protein-like n=1 Tax=Brachyistius frenatus TaxID=100188 RepID=UPI0037E8E352
MNAARKSREKEEEDDDDDVPADSEDDFKYEKVSLEDEWSLTEGEEDLEATVKAIQDRAKGGALQRPKPTSGTHQPTAAEFLRNFLFQMNMTETLGCFQTEWAEMTQTGPVDAELVGLVPDVYTENQQLDSELKNALREREEFKQIASLAAETLVKVQRARDVPRLQHKRLVQEKNRLIEEMRKLKVQCNNYGPAVKRMNEKYQAALKQVLLAAAERDKALGQVDGQSAPRPVPSRGGEEVNRTGASSARESSHPVTRPRPPASPRRHGSQSRGQAVKAHAP